MAQALTREQAQDHGLSFSVEGETYPSDPDQSIFVADITFDGHTHTFQGKSEEDVMAQADVFLRSRGVNRDEPEVASIERGENQVTQEDLLSKDQFLPRDAADEDPATIEEGESA